MAIVKYQLSDGSYVEVECTEEFKREYEFMQIQERAMEWKEKKQKQRAGLRCTKDYSLEKCSEDGYDVADSAPQPLEELIMREERQKYYKKLLRPLTDKQREVYILHHIKGYRKVQIAEMLNISEAAVRKRLFWAYKKILNNFLK